MVNLSNKNDSAEIKMQPFIKKNKKNKQICLGCIEVLKAKQTLIITKNPRSWALSVLSALLSDLLVNSL